MAAIMILLIQGQTPMIADTFEILLEKLNQIEWDSLTSSEHLPGFLSPIIAVTYLIPNCFNVDSCFKGLICSL
jgi:hypothetical protein